MSSQYQHPIPDEPGMLISSYTLCFGALICTPPTESQSLHLIPSADVWYDDGNVVLAAENQAFRVYSGILAQQSQIFADMFAIPQPPVSTLR